VRRWGVRGARSIDLFKLPLIYLHLIAYAI
jgi:hypothetical protein